MIFMPLRGPCTHANKFKLAVDALGLDLLPQGAFCWQGAPSLVFVQEVLNLESSHASCIRTTPLPHAKTHQAPL